LSAAGRPGGFVMHRGLVRDHRGPLTLVTAAAAATAHTALQTYRAV
jgi:hypothetical protein